MSLPGDHPPAAFRMHYSSGVNHLLCYFTGTGNTQEATRQVAASLQDKGHSTQLYAIESRAPMRDWRSPEFVDLLQAADVLLVLFPVYSWSPPAIVLRFIRSLPRGRRSGVPRPAAVVAVDGGDGFRAARRARRALERKGYDVFLSDRVGYPDNWTEMMEPPDEAEAEAEAAAGSDAARSLGRDIAARKERHYHPPGLMPLLLAVIGATFRTLGRRLLGQFYAANEDCTTCRPCDVPSPVGATSIPPVHHARPGWNSRCQSCNRCINICPERAIVTSPGRMLLVVSSIALMAYLLFLLLDGVIGPTAGFIRIGLIVGVILAGHALYFLFPGPLYRLFYRVPGLRSLLSRGFNRNWRRYTFPGFKAPRHR